MKLPLKKKFNKRYFIAFLILLIVVIVFCWGKFTSKNKVPEVFQTKTLKFIYQIKNESNQAIKSAKFSTYLPADSSQQSIGKIDASQNHTIISSDSGNKILETYFDLIPPFGSKKLSVSVEVKNISGNHHNDQVAANHYYKAGKFIELEDKNIIALAEKLHGETEEQTARNIYQWVSSNITDAGYTSQDKGAVFALESGKGDCTEFMYLTIALARANGLAARGIAGYVYHQSSIVKPADYHNWAEVFFDGKWHVVDSQRKFFSDNLGFYIVMRNLSDRKLNLLGNSHRFSVIDNNLKVTML